MISFVLALVSTSSAFAQDPSEPAPPPGANDDCKPGQNPTPVVLVHGTFANRFINFIRIAPDLESHGYCTWALNYGCTTNRFSCGRGPIQDSAAELRDFIEEVEARTGATKVSIVGHSQGGLMPRYYIKSLGGEDEVVDMVSLSASNHGTDHPLAPFSVDCEACRQQYPYRGPFTERVNEGDETAGPIDYTQIQTRFDDTVLPYYSAYLADDPANDYNGPRTLRLNGERTTNYCLQDHYPADFSEHNTIAGDPNALTVIRDALGRGGPAEPPRRRTPYVRASRRSRATARVQIQGAQTMVSARARWGMAASARQSRAAAWRLAASRAVAPAKPEWDTLRGMRL